MRLYGHRYPLFSLAALLAALLLAACSPSGEAGSSAGMRTLEEERPVAYEERSVAYEQAEVREGLGETTSEAEAGSEPPAVENVYESAMATDVREDLAGIPERVYVPNIVDGTVSIIDPETFEIVDVYEVGELPFHVTPSWDMKGLYVNNEASGTFTVIDPKTGRPSGTVEAPFPYNFYYTPDGEKAVVVAERLQTLEFRDPETWEILGSVYIPWPGVDHLDFSADGKYLLASSEWSGVVSKVDVEKMELVDYVEVTGNLPIDIKLSPDGDHFYVANQGSGGVSVIEPDSMEEVGFIPTGAGAHGLQVSRDAKSLYVSNRMEGTVSVVDFATNEVTDIWVTGGTPDMFQLSPDGTRLWVSGRYDGAVYVLDTRSGELLTTIYTGAEPHGITYFPNPGRYSLGHNGVYR